MSTVMYNYRLPKENWWPFARLCRQLYLTKHPIMDGIRAVVSDAKVQKVKEFINQIVADEWTVELQIFDEGSTYLIRPLEHGYFFMNNFNEFAGFGLERVYYDNRSDVPPEEEENAATSKWVDEKIMSKEYLLLKVLDKDDFWQVWFDKLDKGKTVVNA